MIKGNCADTPALQRGMDVITHLCAEAEEPVGLHRPAHQPHAVQILDTVVAHADESRTTRTRGDVERLVNANDDLSPAVGGEVARDERSGERLPVIVHRDHVGAYELVLAKGLLAQRHAPVAPTVFDCHPLRRCQFKGDPERTCRAVAAKGLGARTGRIRRMQVAEADRVRGGAVGLRTREDVGEGRRDHGVVIGWTRRPHMEAQLEEGQRGESTRGVRGGKQKAALRVRPPESQLAVGYGRIAASLRLRRPLIESVTDDTLRSGRPHSTRPVQRGRDAAHCSLIQSSARADVRIKAAKRDRRLWEVSTRHIDHSVPKQRST